MKRFIVLLIALVLVIMLAGCSSSSSGETSSPPVSTSNTTSSSSLSTSGTPSGSSTSFTNEYGTPTTKCAHSGCSNYIANTGDTNCCTVHSHKCLECGKYIDEDATWCMDCLEKAKNKSTESTKKGPSGSSKGPWHSSNVKSDGMGPYPCYGNGDTCNNTTNNYKDLYCDSCDPDGDNKENK